MKVNVHKLKRAIKNDYVNLDDIIDQLDPSIEERIEQEIHSVLDEMETGPHADSQEYRQMLNALKDLIETKNNLGDNDRKNNNDRPNINWDVVIPILIKAGFSFAAIVFWISLEQGSPVPNRLANWVTNLLRA